MNVSELIQAAYFTGLDTPQMEAAALQMGISLDALSDLIAKTIALDYVNGSISWEFGDKVMNRLYGWAYGPLDVGLSEFAWDVYIAFDEGEYIHKGDTPGLPSDARTMPLIKQALGVASA